MLPVICVRQAEIDTLDFAEIDNQHLGSFVWWKVKIPMALTPFLITSQVVDEVLATSQAKSAYVDQKLWFNCTK